MEYSEIKDKNYAIVRVFENKALKIEKVYKKYLDAKKELIDNAKNYEEADFAIVQLKWLQIFNKKV
ncbi:Uncharacterised protein [Mycoplasmopsis maculosa]|uniref:Uncharacterized protein n=1 Tax=Mycoplasmopsis maculosa TaxID=114885 RepID=A0A449B453_9BACT|nr:MULTISPECIES: hypothetical protein [Mycoplasmopsis]WQQ16132.1 hypothetical protein RRG51_03925 [Mycoplasmopsis cynos]VEU75384.1 Uncharacterised protein [Mycoplasmopsis maculosa]